MHPVAAEELDEGQDDKDLVGRPEPLCPSEEGIKPGEHRRRIAATRCQCQVNPFNERG